MKQVEDTAQPMEAAKEAAKEGPQPKDGPEESLMKARRKGYNVEGRSGEAAPSQSAEGTSHYNGTHAV